MIQQYFAEKFLGATSPCSDVETGCGSMIELTRLNDTKFMLNADLIETIEEVPDTVVALTTGKKLFVKESRYEIRDLIVRYKQEVFNKIL